MSQKVGIEILTVHRDARGSVFEPLEPDAFPGQRNVHVVFSEPGAVRGNHFHPRGTEVLTVAGPALVRTRYEAEMTDTTVPEGEVYRFTIPPGVSHAIKNTSDQPAVTVAFNSEAHNLNEPDLVRDVLL